MLICAYFTILLLACMLPYVAVFDLLFQVLQTWVVACNPNNPIAFNYLTFYNLFACTGSEFLQTISSIYNSSWGFLVDPWSFYDPSEPQWTCDESLMRNPRLLSGTMNPHTASTCHLFINNPNFRRLMGPSIDARPWSDGYAGWYSSSFNRGFSKLPTCFRGSLAPMPLTSGFFVCRLEFYCDNWFDVFGSYEYTYRRWVIMQVLYDREVHAMYIEHAFRMRQHERLGRI